MGGHQRAVITLFGVLLFATLFATIPTSAQEPGAGVMQSEDARNLTYEQNTMYMYGSNDDGGPQSSWPMWTHSAPSDVDSDESLSESNVPGDENNGGGPRTYTWDGSNPSDEPIPVDNSIPITGAIHLTIVCNVEQDQCSKQVTIVLRLGNRDLAQQAIDQPDEDNYYHFEFYFNDEEIPAGETFGLRMSFQKPQGFTDGYNLYFGNGCLLYTSPSPRD